MSQCLNVSICLNNQPSLRVPNPVATATAMIPPLRPLGGHWQLSELPGEKQNSTSQQTNNKKIKKHIQVIQDFSRHTQRLRDFETLAAKYSSIIVYHIYVYVYASVHLQSLAPRHP